VPPSLSCIFGLGTLHSPSEVQKTVAPSAEGICQVKPKKIAVKVVAGSVAARMDVRLVKDGLLPSRQQAILQEKTWSRFTVT